MRGSGRGADGQHSERSRRVLPLHLVVGGDPCVSIAHNAGQVLLRAAEFGSTPSAERRLGAITPPDDGRWLCSCLKSRLIHLLPGYADAPWAITDTSVPAAHRQR